MPKRIQLSRKGGWRLPPNTVVVSRPTKWGNPFRPGSYAGPVKVVDAAHAVACFRASLLFGGLGVTIEAVRRELRGKNLAWWCAPRSPCHADVLLEEAN